jgi:hypothetical protein
MKRRLKKDGLLRSVEVVPPKAAPRRLPTDLKLPEKDGPIVVDAIDAGASILLTGDLKHFGQYYGEVAGGVRILPPAEYLWRKRKRK